jgi:hypothetical protein
MDLRGRWRRTAIANKLMVVLTALLCLVTAVNVFISFKQASIQSLQA